MSTLSNIKKFFPQVLSVTDASRNAVIEVTKKDVDSSKIKKHAECAMAVACKRKFHVDGVVISRTVAYLVKGKRARRFHLPESVSREVVSFDRGAGFAPGNYELAAISPSNKMGVRAERKLSKSRTHVNDNKRFMHVTVDVRHRLDQKVKK